MLAVPPDARPTRARDLGADAPVVREGVRLAIAGRPSFTPGEDGDFEPGMDGGARAHRRRLARPSRCCSARSARSAAAGWWGSRCGPFQYDEAALTLRATPDADRARGLQPAGRRRGAPGDRERARPACGSRCCAPAVLNFDQAAPWRVAPAGAFGSGSLFSRAGAGRDGGDGVRRVAARGARHHRFDGRVAAALRPARGERLSRRRADRAGQRAPPRVSRGQLVRSPTPPSRCRSRSRTRTATACSTPAIASGPTCARGLDRSGASQYQRWWGDAEVLYATVESRGRSCAWPRARAGAAPLRPRCSRRYPQFQHWEHNFAIIMPFINSPTDTTTDICHWTEYALYYDRQDTIQFGIEQHRHDARRAVHGELGGPRLRRAQRVGGGEEPPGPAHHGRGFGRVVRQASPTRSRAACAGSALSEGLNRLVDWGKGGTGAPDPVTNFKDKAGLNWFEATYWRRFDAVHDVLACNNADAVGRDPGARDGLPRRHAPRLRRHRSREPGAAASSTKRTSARAAVLSLDLQDSVATGQRHSYVVAAAQDPLDPAYGPHVSGERSRRARHAPAAGIYRRAATTS